MNGHTLPPALIETFAHGWARTRGVAPPVSDGQALRIETGLPEETRRYVVARPPGGIAELGQTITDPHILIKAPMPASEVAALLPPHWFVEQTGTIMMVEAMPDTPPTLPPDLRLTTEWAGPVFFVHIVDPQGIEAGRGRMTIIDGWVLHDRVRVADTYQRRGLGRAIMLALGNAGAARGAGRGLLAATEAGRALYQTLGWQTLAPWTTAQIKP